MLALCTFSQLLLHTCVTPPLFFFFFFFFFREHQCLSMPGPSPTSPMATHQCWRTSWPWSWSERTALWVRAAHMGRPSQRLAQPKKPHMWIDGCRQCRRAQQGGLNFNEMLTLSAAARHPAALTFGLHSNRFWLCSLAAPVLCAGGLLLSNFRGKWFTLKRGCRREEGSWLITLRASGML